MQTFTRRVYRQMVPLYHRLADAAAFGAVVRAGSHGGLGFRHLFVDTVQCELGMNVVTNGIVSQSRDGDDVEKRVQRVFKEVLALEELPRDLDCSIAEDLAVDSIDQLSLFMALEDEFGARIREEDVERVRTLRDVVAFVRERLSPAAAR